MSDIVFKKAMQKARTTWGNAKERAESSRGMGETVEDGRYKSVIKDVKIGMSQSSQRLQVAWTYEILEGESKGKTKMDWDGADTEDNQMWLGRKLVRLGYDIPDDLEDVENILAEIRKKKPVVRITLKTKGEFQKVYVDKVLTGEEASGEDDEVEETETPEAEQVSTKEEVSDEVLLQKGMLVSFDLKGKETVAKVLEILEEEGKVRVQTGDDKIYKVSSDILSVVEEETEEKTETEEVPEEPEAIEEEEEKPKVIKKKPEVKKKK